MILEFLKKQSKLNLTITFIVTLAILTGLAFLIYWLVGVTGNIIWHKCIVPYKIDSSFTEEEVKVIREAMDTITEQSGGIKFVERDAQIEFIDIRKVDEKGFCDSKVAKQLGGEPLNLHSDCITRRIILHELLHVLGFHHEHSRPDRNTYITVHSENIQKDGLNQYAISKNKIWYDITRHTPYDFKSILHYSNETFAKPDTKTFTIIAKEYNAQYNPMTWVGKSTDLSEIDILRLQKYYKLYK